MNRKIAAAQVPHRNPGLYLDYLENFDRLAAYYAVDYRATAAILAHAERVAQREYPRQALAAILSKQSERHHAGKKTAQALKLLQEPETVAVVTGQQTGLFGGPLLTIYKALTAAKLAERLQARRGRAVVTIFWLASDDDDLIEADQCGVLDRNNGFQKISSGFGQLPRRPLSHIVFNDSIADCHAALSDLLADSEFKSTVLAQLAQFFRPGARLVDAFASWLHMLTSEFGLIIVDPSEPDVKRLAAPLFAKEITGRSPSTAAARSAIARLEKMSYSPQVRLRDGRLNLFYVDGEQRHAIEVAGNDFRSTDGLIRFSESELLATVEKTPERLSPNVILRPVVQDYLLPTVAYVAGPSEVAYFAEHRGVYEAFGIPMPAIYPRKSLTLLEKRVERTMEKYGLHIHDLWKPIEPKISELAKNEAPDGLFEPVSAARDELTRELQKLRQQVATLDPTLEGFIDNTAGKILHQLDGLDKKLTQAVKRQNETLTNQLRKVATAVFPNNQLQERSLSVLPFSVKHGGALIRKIYEEIDLGDYDHQVVTL